MSPPNYIRRALDQKLSVSMNIHPSDGMFKQGKEDHYHRVGREAAQKIASILVTVGRPEPRRILDFGCGFGRVTRYLRAVFPSSDIFAADVSPSAIEFCARTFRCEAIISLPDISEVRLPTDLDLIWAGSVATHLPEASTRALLATFASHLGPNGVAVLTGHGRYPASTYLARSWPYQVSEQNFREAVSKFNDDQYAYVDYENRTGYGISLTPGSWWAREVSRYADLCQVAFIERGWDKHQDVIAIRREPAYRNGIASLTLTQRENGT